MMKRMEEIMLSIVVAVAIAVAVAVPVAVPVVKSVNCGENDQREKTRSLKSKGRGYLQAPLLENSGEFC